MNELYLGIDTSNYTTSVSLLDENGIIANEKQLLNVKPGERGVRQSDAVFMHTCNLPVKGPPCIELPVRKFPVTFCSTKRTCFKEENHMKIIMIHHNKVIETFACHFQCHDRGKSLKNGS